MAESKEYKYCGPEHKPPRVKEHDSPLSPQNAIAIIWRAWGLGRTHLGTHFRERCRERGIDTLDVENLIRSGAVRGTPVYCPINKNWKYQVAGFVDERELEVVIALDPAEDFTEMPLVILITAYVRNS